MVLVTGESPDITTEKELLGERHPESPREWQELLQAGRRREAELEARLAELQQALDQAEERQARQEARYMAMINSFEGFIYICSSDYRIDFMNERLKARVGRDATGEICHSALVGRDEVCPWCVKERVLEGEAISWDIRSPEDDCWYHVSNTRIRQPDGSVLKQSLITDISNRKSYEEGLLETTETLRVLMDMMPVGVGWCDYDGNVEYLNTRFVEQFGYTREDIPTVEHWFSLAYPDPAEREERKGFWRQVIEEWRANGTPIPPKETKAICKDGSVRQIIRHIQPVRNRILNVYVDITERELVREELLKIQKLESLGVLAGGIAHDFNNILTSVMGNISFARLVLDTPEKADAMLKNAEKASQRAVDLSRQLLTFAKGGQPVKKIVSVQQILQESVTLMLRGTRVKVVLKVPETLHAAKADEGQLSQVFGNIILNAIQAMHGDGTLTIDAGNVTLDSGNVLKLGAGAYLRLSFSDDGCGIPEDVIKKIFDPYFTTKQGGNGLGLASSQSIVTKHGGHLGVTSEVGRGTTFTIHLPSTGVSHEELQDVSDQQTPVSRQGGRILIMDDDGSITNLASGMLQFLGYQVTSCSSGERAVQLYQAALDSELPFVAVIVDLTVPGGMGGKEVAREILALDDAARLIVSSGYSNDPVVAEYREYGFHAALPKPYKVEDLRRALAVVRDPAPAATPAG